MDRQKNNNRGMMVQQVQKDKFPLSPAYPILIDYCLFLYSIEFEHRPHEEERKREPWMRYSFGKKKLYFFVQPSERIDRQEKWMQNWMRMGIYILKNAIFT